MTIVFDEAELVRELEELALQSRVAFAAACAERLLPAYAAFSALANRGDAPALAEMLARVWQDLLGQKLEPDELQADVDRVMRLIPGEDEEPWLDNQPSADDAASAVAYTLRALQRGDSQEAAWAARRAYEALDYYVTHQLGIDDEARVAGHPAVQAELLRQRRDLDELHAASEEPADRILRVRDRARNEAGGVFRS